MGKQWLLCKVAGDGTAGGCNNGTTTTNTKSGGKSRKRRGGDRHVSSSSSSSGCMSAIFHLFDIQHHHFPFHQSPFISESTISIQQQSNNKILKGVEAPRNSLELEEQEKTPRVIVEKEEEVTSSSSSTRKLKQETNFDIPMMRDIQIKTKRSRSMDMNNNDASSECSSSSPAGTKTPNLVARLMGLDLLPENSSSPRHSLSSPRPSSSSSHHPTTPLNPLLSKLSSIKNNYNTRSLPVTPRASTTGRPSTEVVDYHHRLSLQVGNKEINKRRYAHESTTTSEYAKQIAKQVRESISRRVGADITNTSKKKEHRRDEFLVVLKPKRQSPPSSATPFIEKISKNLDQGHGRGKENEPTPPSSSPRLKLLEIKKNNLNKPIISNIPKSSLLSPSLSTEVINAPPSLLPSLKSRSPPPTMMMKEEAQQVIKHHENINQMKVVQKCKKLIASEKYDLRLKKLHHQNEEPANKCIIKKCNNNLKKSTPLSNHLVNNVNTTTKFISFKKDIIVSPSSTTTASPQKQVTYESITQLPSCQSRSYNNTKKTITLSVQHDITTNGNGATGASFSGHFDYISKILSHTGIEKTTPISITHWYSPSHPLHPSILGNLNHPKTVTNRLIFDVVDELLVEILKPYISLKPWVSSATRQQTKSRGRMFGTQLIETLCDKISCFPEANCQVLEDIDGLIECDMKSNTKVIGDIAFEEEAEELVAELERDMVDTLVGEMAAAWITCHVG